MLIHIVFSTKNRADLILPEIERDLFGYLNGIVGNNGSKLILANGTTNHVHLLVSLGKTITISELVGDIKRDSSKWIKKKDSQFKDFYWQEGYGAFSVGQTRGRRGNEIYRRAERTSQAKRFQRRDARILSEIRD